MYNDDKVPELCIERGKHRHDYLSSIGKPLRLWWDIDIYHVDKPDRLVFSDRHNNIHDLL
jgi:hypothetical protein